MQQDPVLAIVNTIAARGGKVRKQGKEFKCQCPAHEDGKSSLQVGAGEKGVVIKCHAGCTSEAVTTALGLKLSDLFYDTKSEAQASPTTRAAAPNAEATYIYEDENGGVLFRVERRAGKQFVQARPDPHSPGSWLYSLGDTRRVLFHLPNLRGAIKSSETIWIVEGEKDVLNLEAIGLVATCNAGGAGKFKREYAEKLAGADVVIVADNDMPGRDHAKQVAEYAGSVARTVRILDLPTLPDKGDVSDWLIEARPFCRAMSALGFAIEPAELLRAAAAEVEPCYTNKPTIFNASDLMAEQFADVLMAVPGVIAEGVTILAGPPKIGKSWMVLGLGRAVGEGGMALNTIPVSEGKVLYLALEDTPRRLQRRLNVMLGVGNPAPANLHFACTWPRLNSGGLDQLEAWLQDNPDCRMVIIDTWAKVKPAGSSDGSMYENDYAAVSQVKTLADAYGVAIVLVHHLRKQGDGDPLNMVAGSTGFTGAVDAIVVLTRPRSSEEGHLYVTGRDVEESRSIVAFDGTNGQWTYLGEAESVEETRTEDSVVKLLEGTTDVLGPKEVSAALDLKEGTAKWLLAKMVQENKIARVGRGKYTNLDNASQQSVGPVALTVQPPLPGVPGATVPFGTMLVGDESSLDMKDVEDFLASDEGFGDD